jgi:hypothetical protein
MNDHTRAETLRQAVAELAEETRLEVVDRLDDPNEGWVQIIDGPQKDSTVERGDTDRYVRLTIECDVGSLDDETHRAHVEQLKAEIHQSLHYLRNYRAK